jgi:hypothetical protein
MENRVDASKLARIGTVASSIAAGLLWVLGMALTPWENGQSDMAVTLHHLGQAELAPVFLHFAFMLTVPACLGLAWLSAGRAPILAAATVVLTVLGSSMSGFLALDFYDLAVGQSLPLAQAMAISDKVGSYPSALIILLPSNFGMLLAMILAAVTAWRAGMVRPWVVVIMAGSVIYGWMFSHGYALPSIGAAVGTAVALALLGYAALGYSRQPAGLNLGQQVAA